MLLALLNKHHMHSINSDKTTYLKTKEFCAYKSVSNLYKFIKLWFQMFLFIESIVRVQALVASSTRAVRDIYFFPIYLTYSRIHREYELSSRSCIQ